MSGACVLLRDAERGGYSVRVRGVPWPINPRGQSRAEALAWWARVMF